MFIYLPQHRRVPPPVARLVVPAITRRTLAVLAKVGRIFGLPVCACIIACKTTFRARNGSYFFAADAPLQTSLAGKIPGNMAAAMLARSLSVGTCRCGRWHAPHAHRTENLRGKLARELPHRAMPRAQIARHDAPIDKADLAVEQGGLWADSGASARAEIEHASQLIACVGSAPSKQHVQANRLWHLHVPRWKQSACRFRTNWIYPLNESSDRRPRTRLDTAR